MRSAQDLIPWLTHLGYWGVTLIIFLEMGVFFCFFLPGDSLLFVVGLMAAKGLFHLSIILWCIVLAAIAGYMLAYWVGFYLGNLLWDNPKRYWMKRKHLEAASDFYKRHGKMALLLGRFIPLMRTMVPVVAGIARMPFPHFVLLSVVGGLLWGTGIVCLGYFLTLYLPGSSLFLGFIVLGLIIGSLIPIVWKFARAKKSDRS